MRHSLWLLQKAPNHYKFETMRIRPLLRALAYGVAALLFAWAGLSVPIHFRSVSPLILSEAAEGTPSAESLAGDYLDVGQIGPAKLILASLLDSPAKLNLDMTIAAIEANRPLLAVYGGPASLLSAVMEPFTIDASKSSNTVSLLLPRDRRAALKKALRLSDKPTVKLLLRTASLQSYETFLPVSSDAGQPLEAIILTIALLAEEAVWADVIDRELLDMSTAALKDPAQIKPLEDTYTALLTLASRTNWSQLTTLLKMLPDLEALRAMHSAAQLAEDHFTQLYTASLLTRQPAAVATYAIERGDDAWVVMKLANSEGEGAAMAMLHFFQPLYAAPSYLQFNFLEESQQELKNFAESQTTLAKAIKGGALCLAGFFLTLSLGAILSIGLKADTRIPSGRLVHLFHASAGVGFAALIWILSEPTLLDFAPNENGQLRIQIASVLPEGLSPDTTSTMFDQVTILVLLLFLVLQGIVFDLGLYVGLGGTVSSLVMVVLEFIDASLMAAYASTLFGIVFVAVLKIGFLRPYRRRLIVAADAHAPSR